MPRLFDPCSLRLGKKFGHLICQFHNPAVISGHGALAEHLFGDARHRCNANASLYGFLLCIGVSDGGAHRAEHDIGFCHCGGNRCRRLLSGNGTWLHGHQKRIGTEFFGGFIKSTSNRILFVISDYKHRLACLYIHAGGQYGFPDLNKLHFSFTLSFCYDNSSITTLAATVRERTARLLVCICT